MVFLSLMVDTECMWDERMFVTFTGTPPWLRPKVWNRTRYAFDAHDAPSHMKHKMNRVYRGGSTFFQDGYGLVDLELSDAENRTQEIWAYLRSKCTPGNAYSPEHDNLFDAYITLTIKLRPYKYKLMGDMDHGDDRIVEDVV
tara:strand:- start:316 stop:741 length:426 start_codon:yes stop_codon:yes gene_type:complete